MLPKFFLRISRPGAGQFRSVRHFVSLLRDVTPAIRLSTTWALEDAAWLTDLRVTDLNRRWPWWVEFVAQLIWMPGSHPFLR